MASRQGVLGVLGSVACVCVCVGVKWKCDACDMMRVCVRA